MGWLINFNPYGQTLACVKGEMNRQFVPSDTIIFLFTGKSGWRQVNCWKKDQERYAIWAPAGQACAITFWSSPEKVQKGTLPGG